MGIESITIFANDGYNTEISTSFNFIITNMDPAVVGVID